MRILSVSTQKPMHTGSGTYLMELLGAFHRAGHEQALMAGVVAEDQVLLPEGVAFYPMHYESAALPFPVLGMSDQMPYPSTRYDQMDAPMLAQFERAWLRQMQDVLEAFKPELILCHHLYLLTALLREHFPKERILAISHGSCLRQLQTNAFERERILQGLRGLDQIFALHRAQQLQIAKLLSLPAEAIQVIGTGYRSDRFHARGRRAPGQILRLIFAGKLSRAKGLFSLMEALELLGKQAWRMEQLELVLAGSGAEAAALERAAQALPYPVKFLGRLSQEDLAHEFRQADLMVLPSFYEGLPLVLIEALASGCRVLSTDLPGIRPWLDEALPGHDVVFVRPPAMEALGQPRPDALPGFAKALADGLQVAAKLTDETPSLDCRKLSWEAVAERLSQALGTGVTKKS